MYPISVFSPSPLLRGAVVWSEAPRPHGTSMRRNVDEACSRGRQREEFTVSEREEWRQIMLVHLFDLHDTSSNMPNALSDARLPT